MEIDKIVVVKKKTALEELLRRYLTTSQVKFYLESRGLSYDFYKDSHDAYKLGLKQCLEDLPATVRTQLIDRDNLENFLFGERDLVIAVGGDGLLVNLAKYTNNQPIISLNPDPDRFDGVLASCCNKDFPELLKLTLDSKAKTQMLTMAQARLDDGQIIYALNDLFIGRNTHVSARYMVDYNGTREQQSSSGIIVSTGTGSTGWMTSVVIGANAVANGKSCLNSEVPFPRNADYLLFAVREPFPTKITGTSVVYGKITNENPLRIVSNMPENGVIFSDGIESDYLDFNAGRTAIVEPSPKKAKLVLGRR